MPFGFNTWADLLTAATSLFALILAFNANRIADRTRQDEERFRKTSERNFIANQIHAQWHTKASTPKDIWGIVVTTNIMMIDVEFSIKTPQDENVIKTFAHTPPGMFVMLSQRHSISSLRPIPHEESGEWQPLINSANHRVNYIKFKTVQGQQVHWSPGRVHIEESSVLPNH